MFRLVEMLIENKETVLLEGDLGRCFRCEQAFLSLLHHSTPQSAVSFIYQLTKVFSSENVWDVLPF